MSGWIWAMLFFGTQEAITGTYGSKEQVYQGFTIRTHYAVGEMSENQAQAERAAIQRAESQARSARAKSVADAILKNYIERKHPFKGLEDFLNLKSKSTASFQRKDGSFFRIRVNESSATAIFSEARSAGPSVEDFQFVLEPNVQTQALSQCGDPCSRLLARDIVAAQKPALETAAKRALIPDDEARAFLGTTQWWGPELTLEQLYLALRSFGMIQKGVRDPAWLFQGKEGLSQRQKDDQLFVFYVWDAFLSHVPLDHRVFERLSALVKHAEMIPLLWSRVEFLILMSPPEHWPKNKALLEQWMATPDGMAFKKAGHAKSVEAYDAVFSRYQKK